MSAPCHHTLCLYEDDEVLSAETAPYLKAGVDGADAVIAVIDRRKWELLHDSLGRAADAISYIDRDAFYTRPEGALAVYDAQVRRLLSGGAPRVRMWGEFPPFTDPAQTDTWIAYEAVLNRAFAHRPVEIMCGYDAREHAERMLDGARRTHPQLLAATLEDNAGFRGPRRSSAS